MNDHLSELVQQAEGVLARFAKLLPERHRVDWQKHRAAVWRESKWDAGLEPVTHCPGTKLTQLVGIDKQRDALQANTESFCRGFPVQNALLWGGRGTGKSSLIHALLNHLHPRGLRVVEVRKRGLAHLHSIAETLAREPFRFLLVCDDLSFEADDANFKHLKSALDGSVLEVASNVLIYATSNRRHLVPDYESDNQASFARLPEIHASEVVEERLSLSDRFGLWLPFRPFSQDTYLEAVSLWLREIGAEHAISVELTPEIRRKALQYALKRGVRSGRTANHFARTAVAEALEGDRVRGRVRLSGTGH